MKRRFSGGKAQDAQLPASQSGVFKGAGRINRLFLRAYKIVGGLISRTYLRVHCEGIENVPPEGAYLIVTNHQSGLDSFLLGIVIDRPVYCLAKVELYKGPILTWILNAMGYIPLDRTRPDIPSMRIVMRLLKSGEAIGIAPEGTRSDTGELLPFTHGATKLALHAKVPLLPVSVHGSGRLLPPGTAFIKPGKVYIKFGKLFDLSESYGKPMTPEVLDQNTEIIRQRISELFEDIKLRPLR